MIVASRYYLASLHHARTKPKSHLTPTSSVDGSREVGLCPSCIVPKWKTSGQSVMSLDGTVAIADSHTPYLRLVVHIVGVIY